MKKSGWGWVLLIVALSFLLMAIFLVDQYFVLKATALEDQENFWSAIALMYLTASVGSYMLLGAVIFGVIGFILLILAFILLRSK
jgi:uncharacterized membrane protein (UPF0182 family)